ncbi:hypothetical protein LBMAG55_16180 [Verrucomicrobiota bacterium]|nr:hypothetical protein LBMAG55_16180 [Verrucomicrobiota bacterium]
MAGLTFYPMRSLFCALLLSVGLLPAAFDKAAILAQRKERIDKPERFADRHFFPGGLLILGELVP